MGLSLVEMAIGKYPIPPPTEDELLEIFGCNAMEDHLDAANTGRALKGILQMIPHTVVSTHQFHSTPPLKI